MKLWKIWQDQNTGYDTFDSAVVAAESAERARFIHPEMDNAFGLSNPPTYEEIWEIEPGSWAPEPAYVVVEYLGEAREGLEEGVVCASFNAG